MDFGGALDSIANEFINERDLLEKGKKALRAGIIKGFKQLTAEA